MAAHTQITESISLPQRLKHAISQQKASPFRVAADLAKLSWQPNGLQPAEYFMYRPWCEFGKKKETFLGSTGYDRINSSWIGSWPEFTADRLSVYTVLRGFDLMIPTIQAVFGGRSFPGARQLRAKKELIEFLRRDAQYPLTGIPAHRSIRRDPVRVTDFVSKSDELQLHNGDSVRVEDFASQITENEELVSRGYLFHSALCPHPRLANLTGKRRGTIRLHCLARTDGFHILRASMRLSIGNNATDSLLSDGNILAGIDVESGRVTHAISTGALEYTEIEEHPETGEVFEGFRLPDWHETCETVIKAASTASFCLVQGWDVVLTEDGPVLVDLHAGGGDPMFSQLGFPTGLLEGSYARFAERSLASVKRRRRPQWSAVKARLASHVSDLTFHGSESTKPGSNATESDTPVVHQGQAKEATDAAHDNEREEFQLETEANTDFSFTQRMLHAVATHEANLVTMMTDVAKLSGSPNRLPPYEYFLYQLWNEEKFDMKAKHTFIGSEGWIRINKAMLNIWAQLAEDKLALAAVLRANGLPIPKTQAIYHRERHFPDASRLVSKEDVYEFLRGNAAYPLFGKPVGGQQSCGVAAIERYDSDTDELVLSAGKRVSVKNFVDQITATAEISEACDSVLLHAGYLFQSQLQPHPELRRIAGDRMGTVRVVCVADEQGVEIVRASWKIPVGDNVADNLWRGGNMLGGIELETGEMLHVVKPGPLECEFVTEHPDSGVSFEGLHFPEWAAVREVVERAAALIKDCTFQGWDVALCEDGPVLVELQAGGGNPVLAQLGYSTGLLTGRYAEHVRRAMTKKR